MHVAADVKMRTFFEPAVDFPALFKKSMLDIDFCRRIAGKGGIHSRKDSIFQVIEPFELVKEVVGETLVAEKEPVFSYSAGCSPFSDEGPERRDTCSGSDHDDRRLGNFRQAETVVRVNINWNRIADGNPVGQIS